MRDELIIDTPEQLHALAHPLRQRILHMLMDAPSTNQQMALAFGVSPPRLHFHVRELLAAGLIELVAERPKGSIIEKYYRASARILRLGPHVPSEISNEELVDTSLEVARQDLLRAIHHFGPDLPLLKFTQQSLRLSGERLERIQGLLDALYAEVIGALADPARETYTQQVALTFLLHSLPPGQAPQPE